MRKSFLLSGILMAALCLSAAAFAKDDPKPKAKPEPVNTKCPITGEDVDATAPTTKYKGKLIGFCCKDCPKKFAALKPAEKEEKVKAVLADSTDDKKETDKKPAKDPKEVASAKAVNKNCAVETDHAVDSTVATVPYKGKNYGFCCEDCIKKFNADPESFAKSAK